MWFPAQSCPRMWYGLLDAAKDSPLSVKTLQGQHIDITKDEAGDILINGAKLNLTMVDIEASNGVIHVIDSVIMPETKTIAELVVDAAVVDRQAGIHHAVDRR